MSGISEGNIYGGIARGIERATDNIAELYKTHQQQAFQQRQLDVKLEWNRGRDGLGPSYEDEEDPATATPNVRVPGAAANLRVPGAYKLSPNYLAGAGWLRRN
jgi:hypothetical protein